MHISVWEKESFYAPSDVIIAGSGFAGLWSAYFLKKKHPHLSITIIERGIIPNGASTRNAGFACFGSVTELLHDAGILGEENMLHLVEMRYKGLGRILKVFKKKEIDFSMCGGYELITSAKHQDSEELCRQINRLNKLLSPFLKKSKPFALSDEKIKTFGFRNVSHLIENKLEGCLHPGKLCLGLLRKVQSMGVRVLNNMEIIGQERNGDKIVLLTSKDIPLVGNQLLVCTSAFANQLLPELELIPARGQVLVTSPIPGLAIKGSFHYDEGYYYFRNLGNRLLLGGARNKAIEEETTSEMEISDIIQKELESFLANYLIPGIPYRITDRWSGIMGTGLEKLPLVKKISPNVFCLLRMGGMGVALAPVLGEKVAKMMVD